MFAPHVVKPKSAPAQHPAVAAQRPGRFAVEALQRTIGNQAILQLAQRAGRPLEPTVRREFEQCLGHDFSAVRIHCDSQTTRAAATVGARAYTLGHHIAIKEGLYHPSTTEGRRLLAHELTHAAQQAEFGDHQLAGAKILEADHPSERQARTGGGAATPLAAPAIQFDRGTMGSPGGTTNLADEGQWGVEGGVDLGGSWDEYGNYWYFEDTTGNMWLWAEPQKKWELLSAPRDAITIQATPRTTLKQAKWEEEFRREYPRLAGVGAISGTRDDGIITPTGIRVPRLRGDLLNPRRFYERKEAAFLAYQGFVHYAELVEVYHDDAAATQIALDLLQETGHQVPNDLEMDLEKYTHWSRNAEHAAQGAQLLAAALSGLQAPPEEAAPAPPPTELSPDPATSPRVWVNTKSGVYHAEGSPFFGATKKGRYLTQAQADAAGYRAAKPSNLDAARLGTAEHARMTAELRQFEGVKLDNGWEMRKVERTVGGTKRIDQLWVNEAEKKVAVTDYFTGQVEPAAHYAKGMNYRFESEVVTLLTKGYTYEYHPVVMPGGKP